MVGYGGASRIFHSLSFYDRFTYTFREHMTKMIELIMVELSLNSGNRSIRDVSCLRKNKKVLHRDETPFENDAVNPKR